MGGRRATPRVCGVMGAGDVCGRAAYHKGMHIGRWSQERWPVEESDASRKGREARSRAGSEAEEAHDVAARNQYPPPPFNPPRVPRRTPRIPKGDTRA